MYNEVRKVHISVILLTDFSRTAADQNCCKKITYRNSKKGIYQKVEKISFVGYLINDAIIPDNRESRLFRICFVNTLISPWYKGVVLNFHDSTLEISRD